VNRTAEAFQALGEYRRREADILRFLFAFVKHKIHPGEYSQARFA